MYQDMRERPIRLAIRPKLLLIWLNVRRGCPGVQRERLKVPA